MDGDRKSTAALAARNLSKTFLRESGEIVTALDEVSFSVETGTLTALMGPDGAGKTTLLRIAAGLLAADGGELNVLSMSVASRAQAIQDRLGYMPQRFGLYEDLSVQENLDLYADLNGVALAQRRERYPRLMEMTGLGEFTGRLAGKLSGGMKQKLGLACTLVSAPEFLLLDEPTAGVDPISRRDLWLIIHQLVRERELTVLVSTSYLDEVERCSAVVLLHGGRVLLQGEPAEASALAEGRTFLAAPPSGMKARTLQARLYRRSGIIDAVPQAGRVRLVAESIESGPGQRFRLDALPAGSELQPTQPRLEDGFMVLLRSQRNREMGRQGEQETGRGGDLETRRGGDKEREDRERDKGTGRQGAGEHGVPSVPGSLSPFPPHGDAIVEARELVRRFGDFTAVDQVSFEVRQGEIFGLLGPNGAGKTTTFRMLCGLLPASGGTLRVAGVDLRRARASARQRIGYVAQKFSLYGQLSVRENLEFFAGAYNLRGGRKQERIAWALEEFGLTALAELASGQLPGGFKQRLAMAVALMHEPETLFLDEPTSGADPLARREFWHRIVGLADAGITVVITTHFLEEAEYCDRVAIMDAGRVLAQGKPAEIRALAGGVSAEPTMEDAFISVVERYRESRPQGAAA